MLVTENQLDEWVRGNSRECQGLIVELVWRLVAASVPRARERRFPLADSIGQHGPDGHLIVDAGFEPFIPEGRSFWEIGTGLDASGKATSDFRGLTEQTPRDVRMNSSFVFVTPLSGRRGWEGSWKEEAQLSWIEKYKALNEWRDVRVIDGTKIIDWLRQFPAVEIWLAQHVASVPIDQVDTLARRWGVTSSIGEPPPLSPQLFLANREEAAAKLQTVFADTTVQLKLSTRFPDQIVDFVAAYVASLNPEERADAEGRAIVVSGVGAWNAISSQKEKHILIADSSIDLNGPSGTKLIQSARKGGHAIVFGALPGGIPDPATVALRSPSSQKIKDALQQGGYGEERARTLSQKSAGNLSSLLRCIQNLSLMPQWAEAGAASELAIAEMLGSWSESSEADVAVVEELAGKPYGEWVAKIQEVVLNANTPLLHSDGSWTFVLRYEGWYALGPRVFHDHLERIRAAVIRVLGERDPQFDLPKEERYAAQLHNKVPRHSSEIRRGLAEAVALLGSHPKALTSVSLGEPEQTASRIVRELLLGAEWERWAGLNHLLPLLAEAAPHAFLEAIEHALRDDRAPLRNLFLEEGDAMVGRSYVSGVLWALETLAWDSGYVNRTLLALGELASIDPGGKWANRPSNSLVTILLPWMPQTCAPIERRVGSVATLLKEVPEIGWRLLLALLPKTTTTTSGTRRPEWRDTIPADWRPTVTQADYWQQVQRYADLAIDVAVSDVAKLAELVSHIDNLPPPAWAKIVAVLTSGNVTKLEDVRKKIVWSSLMDVITKHTKYAEAAWAMPSEKIQKLNEVAQLLAPAAPEHKHARLFSDRDFELYEGRGNWDAQAKQLEMRRKAAIQEVVSRGGAEAVLDFSKTAKSPWRVGLAFGPVSGPDADKLILPSLLAEQRTIVSNFVNGYVWGKFQVGGWDWVDSLSLEKWSPREIAQLLAYLPFGRMTWQRVLTLLGDRQDLYWKQTQANAYDAEADLEYAANELRRYGRPLAALRCYYVLFHTDKLVSPALVVPALIEALTTAEEKGSMDQYEIVELIKALQENVDTAQDDLFRIEWAYLPLLDEVHGASPKILQSRLATQPKFYCEVIRLVFKSTKEKSEVEPSEEQRAIATNAYRLLTQWKTLPGASNGGIDGDVLERWLAEVKQECTLTGHLEIAMSRFGHVLAYGPADPDGLWIHRAVASVLNEKSAEEARQGFSSEIYNLRGVHWVDPTGAPELTLSQEYLRKAEAVEDRGFSRLGAVLRSLSDGYRLDAERIRKEHSSE